MVIPPYYPHEANNPYKRLEWQTLDDGTICFRIEPTYDNPSPQWWIYSRPNWFKRLLNKIF